MSPVPALPLTLTHKPLMHLQVKFHAFQLVIGTEGNTASSFSLPVRPKETLSFHASTAITGAIPPGHPDTIRYCPAGTSIIPLVYSAYGVHLPRDI